MQPELHVTFEPVNLDEMRDRFQEQRSSFPWFSVKDYFRDPKLALEPFLNRDPHVLAFRFKLYPDSPESAWYMIKTGEVARKVFDAPRYGVPGDGHPFGEGPHTGILRSVLAVDKCPGAGTNNVMMARADKHEHYSKPLREELLEGLDRYIPLMAECIQSKLPNEYPYHTFDINSFCRNLVQDTVLAVIGLPPDTITIEDVTKSNAFANKIALGVEGALDEFRSHKNDIDRRVLEGLKFVKEGTLLWALQKHDYTEIDCRETVIAFMIGARNGCTALIHLIWMLSRNLEMQRGVAEEYCKTREDNVDWATLLKEMPMMKNLFRYALLTHSPVKTMNRNAINPMVLTVGEQSYPVFPGDRLEFFMSKAAIGFYPDFLSKEKLPLPHLPFGVGPNECPASDFIEAIAVMTAGMLMGRYQIEQCDKDRIEVVPSVFTNEFVDAPVVVELKKHPDFNEKKLDLTKKP